MRKKTFEFGLWKAVIWDFGKSNLEKHDSEYGDLDYINIFMKKIVCLRQDPIIIITKSVHTT